MASTASFLPTTLAPVDSPWRKREATPQGGGRRRHTRTPTNPTNTNTVAATTTTQKSPQNLAFAVNSRSPASISKWVVFGSLHTSPFPLGCDPSETDHAFSPVFSQVSTVQSPLLLETTDLDADEIDRAEEVVRLEWRSKLVSPLWSREALKSVIWEDPPWFSHDFQLQTRREVEGVGSGDVGKWKYNVSRRRQIKAETEAWERAAVEYRELQEEMLEKKLAPNLPYVKKLFLGWFEPLRDAIAKEQMVQRTKRQKAAYAKHIGLLPADKMAVILMHKMMGLLMTGQQDECVRVVQAAVHIGDAVEQEVRIHNFLKKIKRKGKKKEVNKDALPSKEQGVLRNKVKMLMKNNKKIELRKLVKSNDHLKPWGRDAQAKLGSRLIEILIESAYVQPAPVQSPDSPPDIRPAFSHNIRTVTKEDRRCGKRYGVIECDPLVHQGLDSIAKHMPIPYMPMLVPPKKWKGYDNGGYLFLPSYVMRTHGSRQQQEAIKNVPPKQLQNVFKALNTLGSTKWRVNKRVLAVVETIWSKGGSMAGLVDRKDVPLPEKIESDEKFEMLKWWLDVKKAKKINNERHALQCDTELKLLVARKMRDEYGFYYPHNLDFRGRAYPMHPHLNHLSSDLCRGILEFAQGRPLGRSGLRWLKIQLANLYAGGVEKLCLDERLAFVENHLVDIFESADRPVDGKQWWLGAEDPFQCLAVCINLSDALRSSSPHNVLSHLPIHQDGSCNGLQHYAALGRDSLEAAAVNLVDRERPADVYSGIATRVRNHILRDSEKDPATCPDAVLAKLLVDQVDRKLVKQTVMTSVYGVTYVGAREQIEKRLEERGLSIDDKLLFSISCYAAKVTMTALGEMFQAARGIMKWLADCAKVIASENQTVKWETPLGLPVVQPYMKSERHLIRTSLQVLALRRESNSVAVKRQKAAFPPNFIHSLDGSHMMMTAVACRDANLHFAGVHDSFWTHACDVDKMNRILREQFVELYNIPILENLQESFQSSYPTLTFPPLPERGNFDIRQPLQPVIGMNRAIMLKKLRPWNTAQF